MNIVNIVKNKRFILITSGIIILGVAALLIFLLWPKADVQLSMVVQPDRINLLDDEHDITAFSNDNISLEIYLANQGKKDVDEVKAVLEAPEDVGFNLINETFDFESIEQGGIGVGEFSLSTLDVAPGTYDLSLSVTYQKGKKERAVEYPLKVKVLDVGILGIKHLRFSQYLENASEDFLAPSDQKILGYTAMFASTNRDSFLLTIYNGKTESIEDVNIEIVSKDDINIEFTIREIGVLQGAIDKSSTDDLTVLETINELWAGNGQEYIIDVVTNDISAGKHSFTLNINYMQDGNSYNVQQDLVFGIFDVSLESSIAETGSTPTTKSFEVKSKIKTEAANKDIMEIDVDFNLEDIIKPADYEAIDDSIKEIIEEVFPLYFNDSDFNHQRSDWLKAQLKDKNDAEIKLIARALLNEFKFMSGGIIGYDLGGKITSELLEGQGFNSLIELESEGAAQEAGSYYGEVVLNDGLSNSAFFDSYSALVKKEDLSIKTESVGISDIEIFLDLSAASNKLPIFWSLVSDEDSNFRKDNNGFEDINIDNLPMTLMLDLSQLNKKYNINRSYPLNIIIKSSNNTYVYKRSVFGDYVALNIDRLEKSDYYNAVAFVDLTATGIKNVIGVSESLIFKVSDGNQPEKSHNDVMDFLSQKDIETMNDSSNFYIEFTILEEEGALARVTNYVFKKSIIEYEGADISLTSTEYNEGADTTTLLFEISANETKEFTLDVDTSFIEDYPINKNIESIQDKSVKIDLVADVVSTLPIEVDGRFGYDFNKIGATISGSPLTTVEIIGLIGTIIGLIDPTVGKAWSKGKDIFEIQFGGHKLNTQAFNVYIGERFMPIFVVHFIAKGMLDYNETYRIEYKITPGDSGVSEPFVGGANYVLTTSYLARGPFCKGGETEKQQITVEASVSQPSDWFCTNHDLAGEDPDFYECKQGPFYCPGGHSFEYDCRYWARTNGPERGSLVIWPLNPLRITSASIKTDPDGVEHGQSTEASIKMKFEQHGNIQGLTSEASPDITITSIPIACSDECSITPLNLPLTINAGESATARFNISHEQGHLEEEETIHLRIDECSVTGAGENVEPWSVTAPDTGNKTGSFACRKSIELGSCGDGVLQTPNTEGQMEQCDPPGKYCPEGKECVSCICETIDEPICPDNKVTPPEECDPPGDTGGCDGLKIETCSDTCTWETGECDKATCGADCAEGGTKCVGTKTESCDGDTCDWDGSPTCVKDECGAYCGTGETICVGAKTMSCDENICDWDDNPVCVKDECGGSCAIDSDCNENETCNTETCACESSNQEPVVEGLTVTQLHEYEEDLPHRYQLVVSASDPDGDTPLTYEWSVDCGYFFVNSMQVSTPPPFSTSSNSIEWRYDTYGECSNATVTITVTDSQGASKTFTRKVFP